MAKRALDLFCGAGGASMGLYRAGYDVTGVDLHPQPHYPFRFIQADAFTIDLTGYDLIWASPPCQAYTTMSNRWRGKGGRADSHVDLIGAIRACLYRARSWYVIENVMGARRELMQPVLLTGEMFGLGVHRPRLFEYNWPVGVPPARPAASRTSIGVYGKAHDGRLLWRRRDGTEQHAVSSLAEARAAMGIDWMIWRELCEAIPPSYAEWVGRRALAHAEAA